MEAVMYEGKMIGDVEDVSESFEGQPTWYATTTDPETLEVIAGEIWCTKEEAVESVKTAWKEYIESPKLTQAEREAIHEKWYGQ